MNLHPLASAHDFGAKLRLTALVLGCATQKDLALAFRRRNPNTAFDLPRSYKWAQGRTLPRSPQLYAEWSELLDLGRPADALLACSLDQFRAWLAERYGPLPELLNASDEPAPDSPSVRLEGGFLYGVYACYSHAQSPYYRGRIVRGALLIGAARPNGGAPHAQYAQALSGGVARASGPMRFYGQTPCLALQGHSANLAPVFVTLFRPTPPGSVLAGLMLSFTVVDPDFQPPYATRFVAVRVPRPLAEVEASNRYLEPEEWPPLADLAALGMPVAAAPELGACLAASLGRDSWSGCDRIPAEDYLRLTSACDRIWLAAHDQPSRPPAAGPS